MPGSIIAHFPVEVSTTTYVLIPNSANPNFYYFHDLFFLIVDESPDHAVV